MGKKKEEYRKMAHESCESFIPSNGDGTKHSDTSCNVFMSMRFSQAWHNLTYKQKELYSILKGLEYAEKKDRAKLITEKERTTLSNEELRSINVKYRFTFNKTKWCYYFGLYSPKGRNDFYDDMNALIQNGFVKLLQSGQNTKTSNIYELDNKWRELGKWESPYKP